MSLEGAGAPLQPLRLVRGKGSELSTLEYEFLPPLLEIQETPPSAGQRRVIWTIVALTVALLSWSYVGQVSIVATAPGKLIPDGRVKEVQPLETSIVKAIHVREGQHVSEGDLLIELDPTIASAEHQANQEKLAFNQLEQARLAAELTGGKPTYGKTSITAEKIELEKQIQIARQAAHRTKLAQARAALEEKQQAAAAAAATLTKYQQTTEIASEREASARPLVDTGAISRNDYLQLKQDLAQNRNDLAAQEKTAAQARAAVVEADRSLDQVRRDRMSDIYKDLDDRVASESALKGDLDKSTELLSLKAIRAPVSGSIQKLDITTIGQVVSPAQSIITIVPDGTPLIVEATVSNLDIGYVAEGQPAQIKVDTFPFQKYGSLPARLSWVSADAEEKSAASSDVNRRAGGDEGRDQKEKSLADESTGYVYKVHLTVEASEAAKQLPRALQAGMTVQADIVTDRRRVIDFFLSPLTKYLQEGLTVR